MCTSDGSYIANGYSCTHSGHLKLVTVIVGWASSITAPQDAHTRLVLQVYPGSNTLELLDGLLGSEEREHQCTKLKVACPSPCAFRVLLP